MQDAASEPGPTADGAAPRVSPGKGRALVPVPRPTPRPETFAGLGRSHGFVAAGVAVVMGIGFVAGTAVFAPRPQGILLAQATLPAPFAPAAAAPLPSAAPADAALDALNRVQGEVRALRAGLDGLRAAADDDRQADAIRGLKRTVDGLKQEVEGVKVASAGAVGQLGAKLDAKLDRLDRDPGPKLNEISARLDRLEREPDPKAADGRGPDGRAAEAKASEVKASEAKIAQVASQLNARLDRLERQVAGGDATGSIPRDAGAQLAQSKAPLPPQRSAQSVPQPAAQPSVPNVAPSAAQAPAAPAAPQPVPTSAVSALPPPRPETARAEPARTESPRPETMARADLGGPSRQPDASQKAATLDGWLLRDVYGGVALVEGRAGGLREVAPGEYVPGVGEIRSIERRGRGWVVVTSRGLIGADNRW